MVGRFLALCGWLAMRVRRPFEATQLRSLGSVPTVAVALLLVLIAAAPLVIPLFDAQPEDANVQRVFDRAVTHPDGWVRLRGRITPLSESPTGASGSFALLVDATNPLRAIVVRDAGPLAATESTVLSGRLAPAVVAVEEDLPIEATVAGTPPRIVPDRIVVLDAVPKTPRPSLWLLAIPPAVLAALILIGVRAGYPVFRPTSEVDVLAAPLGPGDRVPSAYGGRIGPNRRDLGDPGGVLLLIGRDPRGALLTAQPLADEDGRPAPRPVAIGGSWTSGRIGLVHSLRETIPALHVRAEQVDAIFLFARAAERDRVASHVAVER